MQFDFDAQDAAPIRVLVRKPNKFGVGVFLLDVSHRGHVPELDPPEPLSAAHSRARPGAKPRAGAGEPEPAFEPLEDQGAALLVPAYPADGPVSAGTVNPGNCCYCNAVLVALAHIDRSAVFRRFTASVIACGSCFCSRNASTRQERWWFG